MSTSPNPSSSSSPHPTRMREFGEHVLANIQKSLRCYTKVGYFARHAKPLHLCSTELFVGHNDGETVLFMRGGENTLRYVYILKILRSMPEELALNIAEYMCGQQATMLLSYLLMAKYVFAQNGRVGVIYSRARNTCNKIRLQNFNARGHHLRQLVVRPEKPPISVSECTDVAYSRFEFVPDVRVWLFGAYLLQRHASGGISSRHKEVLRTHLAQACYTSRQIIEQYCHLHRPTTTSGENTVQIVALATVADGKAILEHHLSALESQPCIHVDLNTEEGRKNALLYGHPVYAPLAVCNPDNRHYNRSTLFELVGNILLPRDPRTRADMLFSNARRMCSHRWAAPESGYIGPNEKNSDLILHLFASCFHTRSPWCDQYGCLILTGKTIRHLGLSPEQYIVENIRRFDIDKYCHPGIVDYVLGHSKSHEGRFPSPAYVASGWAYSGSNTIQYLELKKQPCLLKVQFCSDTIMSQLLLKRWRGTNYIDQLSVSQCETREQVIDALVPWLTRYFDNIDVTTLRAILAVEKMVPAHASSYHHARIIVRLDDSYLRDIHLFDDFRRSYDQARLKSMKPVLDEHTFFMNKLACISGNPQINWDLAQYPLVPQTECRRVLFQYMGQIAEGRTEYVNLSDAVQLPTWDQCLKEMDSNRKREMHHTTTLDEYAKTFSQALLALRGKPVTVEALVSSLPSQPTRLILSGVSMDRPISNNGLYDAYVVWRTYGYLLQLGQQSTTRMRILNDDHQVMVRFKLELWWGRISTHLREVTVNFQRLPPKDQAVANVLSVSKLSKWDRFSRETLRCKFPRFPLCNSSLAFFKKPIQRARLIIEEARKNAQQKMYDSIMPPPLREKSYGRSRFPYEQAALYREIRKILYRDHSLGRVLGAPDCALTRDVLQQVLVTHPAQKFDTITVNGVTVRFCGASTRGKTALQIKKLAAYKHWLEAEKKSREELLRMDFALDTTKRVAKKRKRCRSSQSSKKKQKTSTRGAADYSHTTRALEDIRARLEGSSPDLEALTVETMVVCKIIDMVNIVARTA